MTSSTATEPDRFSRVANEADGLIERLRATAPEALAAVERQDLAALGRSIRERESLIRRLTPLLDQIRAESFHRAAADERETERRVRRITSGLEGALQTHSVLVAGVAAAGDAAARELDRLGDGQRQGQQPYRSRKPRPGRKIDLVR